MSERTIRTIPSSRSNMVKGLVLGVVLGGVSIGAPFIAQRVSQSTSDSAVQQYVDVNYVRSACPTLQPKVDEALADGMLSKREAIEIGERMQAMTQAAGKYAQMAPARRSLGLAVAAPPPPPCDNRRPQGDYAMGDILEPLWIR